MSGGVTTVAQRASDARVRAEIVASFDLFLDVPVGRGMIHVYTEANTTPFRDGVSRLIGEANTDAGTAIDQRRRGRVQISEIRLIWPVGEGVEAHGGLLDATGFLDVSRIANDENLFFLGVPFVNNPTIEFPDYALGVALAGNVPGSETVRFAATLSSSHGIADNPNVSYTQLLDVGETGKGVFGGMTLRWVGADRRVSLGGWINSADHERLDGTGSGGASAGVFSVAGWFRGEHSLSARAGLARPSVSTAHAFLGLTWLWMRRPDALGLAIGRSFPSPDAEDAEAVMYAEAFVRRRLFGEVFVTGSIQRIHNSRFDGSGATVAARLWVPGVRLSALF